LLVFVISRSGATRAMAMSRMQCACVRSARRDTRSNVTCRRSPCAVCRVSCANHPRDCQSSMTSSCQSVNQTRTDRQMPFDSRLNEDRDAHKHVNKQGELRRLDRLSRMYVVSDRRHSHIDRNLDENNRRQSFDTGGKFVCESAECIDVLDSSD
jgi:hypothetical protein